MSYKKYLNITKSLIMNVFFTSRIGDNENDVYPNGSPPLYEVIKISSYMK